MNDPAKKPPELSDAEWQQILNQRARAARDYEYDRLADRLAQREDQYARQRQDDLFRSFTAPVRYPAWFIGCGWISLLVGIAIVWSVIKSVSF